MKITIDFENDGYDKRNIEFLFILGEDTPLKEIIKRYLEGLPSMEAEAILEVRDKFTKDELYYLYEIHKDVPYVTESAQNPGLIKTIKQNGSKNKWNIDLDCLAQKIDGLTRYAVFFFVNFIYHTIDTAVNQGYTIDEPIDQLLLSTPLPEKKKSKLFSFFFGN